MVRTQLCTRIGRSSLPTGKLILSGLTAYGYHGNNPAERKLGQTFSADIEVHLDTQRAASTDNLADTISYPVIERIVSPRMLQYAIRNHTGESVDEYMGMPMHRGLGPHLRGLTENVRGLGGFASPRAFGHGGVGTSYCWGDPESGVSFAYVTNNRIPDPWHSKRLCLVANFVHEFAAGRSQDPSLAEWWSVAAGFRRGGTDRIPRVRTPQPVRRPRRP